MPTISKQIQPNPRRISRYLNVVALSVITGLVFYREAILMVLTEVINRNDSSHGVFVPFLSVYFLWTIKERFKTLEVGYSKPGLVVMIACLLVRFSTIGNFQSQFLAFIGFTCGLVLFFLGWPVFKNTAFPLLFLVTMTPLPQDLYDGLANISRTIAFGGSLKIISLLGIPYLRIGWDIELPNALLKVAISCSGIRYLISFFVFGLAYAYLFKTSTISRTLTVASTIPISLFASICRLTIIFTMTYYVGPFWSEHKPHVALSWFIFFTVLFFSMFLDQWLQKKMEKEEKRKRRDK